MLRASETLFNVLVNAFSGEELEILVRYRLKIDLRRIARRGPHDIVVHDVIGYAERRQVLPTLIAAVRDARPYVDDSDALVEEYFETPFRGGKAEFQQLLSKRVPHLDPD